MCLCRGRCVCSVYMNANLDSTCYTLACVCDFGTLCVFVLVCVVIFEGLSESICVFFFVCVSVLCNLGWVLCLAAGTVGLQIRPGRGHRGMGTTQPGTVCMFACGATGFVCVCMCGCVCVCECECFSFEREKEVERKRK